MSRSSNSKTREAYAQERSGLDFKLIGWMVLGSFAITGITILSIGLYATSGLSGPDPVTIKNTIAGNYQIQGIGWDGDGRTNGVGVFNVGTHAYGISVDGTVHTCLANLKQAQAKTPIICRDHFVVQPKP
ncbi:hypothetical protein IV500_04940 [Paeniglutamicibacter antarcticus]|uniref:Uncharacterized protein n=1 Tax=Arthrobacter terrae TaxID=2935737 RepID=A0A931G6Z7_9MICC|nr:hypothetical protein [Arthrobacter terrae]MBG0738764.1 hypothetical protein [Arthrobacter terrae]